MLTSSCDLNITNICYCMLVNIAHSNAEISMENRNTLIKYVTKEVIAKPLLYSKSFHQILFDLEKLPEGKMLSQLLSTYINAIKEIDPLFVFMNQLMKTVKEQKGVFPAIEENTILDLFIRKCCLSFNKLDFSGIISVYEHIVL